MIGKYEMRLKINHFCGNIYNFQEKLQENGKMQITKRPIKIFIIILKRVIRIQQIINIKIALNITVFYILLKILKVFLHIIINFYMATAMKRNAKAKCANAIYIYSCS